MLEKMSENDEKFAQIADTAMTSDVVGISGVKILDMYGKRYVILYQKIFVSHSAQR